MGNVADRLLDAPLPSFIAQCLPDVATSRKIVMISVGGSAGQVTKQSDGESATVDVVRYDYDDHDGFMEQIDTIVATYDAVVIKMVDKRAGEEGERMTQALKELRRRAQANGKDVLN